jgi:phosphoribosylformylglycinamidine synthase
MFLAKIYITLKPGVNDPQGLTIRGGLHQLGFDTVTDVRAGKYMEIQLDQEDSRAASDSVAEMCDQLLANPIIEEFRFELETLESTSP